MPKTQKPTQKKGRRNKAIIAVYVTKEIHAALKAAADRDGRSLCNYLNRILSSVTNTE